MRSTTGCAWKMCGSTNNCEGAWKMRRILCLIFAAGALSVTAPAVAQKSGGVLKIQHWDSPASMSIHEEATYSTVVPIMGVMNNLVLYKQDVPQNSMSSIVPDLGTEWSWSEAGKELTFKLRQASNGMMASRSPPRTSNALGTCCSAKGSRNSAATRARSGTATWKT